MTISTRRRLFLKNSLAVGTIGLAVSAGLITPAAVLAADWPKAAFDADKAGDALKNLFGSDQMADTDKVSIKAPDVAENGAVVPVTISTTLENVEQIALVASNNAKPLSASYDLQPGVKGFVATRIKVGKSGDLIAVVKSDGKLFSAKRAVKVTLGGCG